MTSIFTFPGGAANLFKQNIPLTTVTTISLGADPGRAIAWFRVNEYAGGTPNLTVELYDVATTTSYYLGANSFTWKTKALTALQSLLFDDGYPIPNGVLLRVTCSVGNSVMVEGAYVGRQPSQAWTPQGSPAPAASK